MKIGILTYHACYNYGACLQAYALQQSIKRRYAECDIIDYQSCLLYTLRAHETPEHLVCRLLLEKKKTKNL